MSYIRRNPRSRPPAITAKEGAAVLLSWWDWCMAERARLKELDRERRELDERRREHLAAEMATAFTAAWAFHAVEAGAASPLGLSSGDSPQQLALEAGEPVSLALPVGESPQLALPSGLG